MKLPWLAVTGVLLLLASACGADGASASGGTNGPGGTSPSVSVPAGATVRELYSCTPSVAAYPDPHALALCREMLHRYPVQP